MKTKKNATFYITEDVLMQAKREIPNLSVFVENCFKTYLNIDDEDNMVGNIQDELNIMKEARLKIHLLSESDYNESEVKGFDSKKLNKTWLGIWANYRNTETIIPSEIQKASTVLGKTSEQLNAMMQDLLTYLPKTDLAKCDDWELALKTYEEVISKY